jgi:fermentation-respiration switch protein FrsA (DUF1100 family)
MRRETIWIGFWILAVYGCAQPTHPRVEALDQTTAITTEKIAVPVAEASSTISPSASQSKKPPSIRIRSWQTLDERVLFQPSDASQGNYQPADMRFEDAYFQSSDGTLLHGWYFPCETPRAYVLFAHGNAGNLSFWSQRMRVLQEAYGVCVFIFDYRGYGKSTGKPTVPGVLRDARAAARFLADKAGIKESDIVVMGESLGGAVAVHLAAEIQPRGLILESTFSSFRDVADHHAKWASWLVPRDKLDSARQIGKYRGPLLQCHGDCDSVIPFAFGEKLFQAANCPKTFVTLEGGDHNSLLPMSYHFELDDFLQELSPRLPTE